MLLYSAALLVGFALLVWSADRFVVGAAGTARNLGVPTLIIGLTVVGIGTSAPEILISAIAAATGNPDIAIGNAIGSNITNTALVLGVTALVVPLAIRSETLRRELPLLMVIMLLALGLLLDGVLSRLDGVALLAGMVLLLAWLTRLALKSRGSDPLVAEYSAEIPAGLTLGASLGWLFLGLVVLLASARLLVWGAASMAEALGVSDLVIGLTIVAIGTSLPELAASLSAALKNEHDIAVGNVLGSNMFNLLAVLGLPGIIRPGAVPGEVLTRDFPAMIALTLLFYGFAGVTRWRTGGAARITRLDGALLTAGFGAYLAWLYFMQR